MNASLMPQHWYMQNDIAVYPVQIVDFDFEEEAESLIYDVLFSNNCVYSAHLFELCIEYPYMFWPCIKVLLVVWKPYTSKEKQLFQMPYRVLLDNHSTLSSNHRKIEHS